MQETRKEVLELKKLLTTTRLTKLDRQAIEARIEELSRGPRKERQRTLSPYVLGVFDRPAPPPKSQSVPPKTAAPVQPPKRDLPPSIQPPTEEETKGLQTPFLTPEQIEARCKLLADIADRVSLLRAVWATTLSFEVSREAETWLQKLQELAAILPREVAERALGIHVGYLDQRVQVVARPQIPERVQEQALPPSMPNGRNADVVAELYWLQFAPPRQREPHHPPGYVPDGLQSWVS